MSNISNSWLGGPVVPACGHGYAAAGFGVVGDLRFADRSAEAKKRTRGTTVTAARTGAETSHPGRPAWSPPTT